MLATTSDTGWLSILYEKRPCLAVFILIRICVLQTLWLRMCLSLKQPRDSFYFLVKFLITIAWIVTTWVDNGLQHQKENDSENRKDFDCKTIAAKPETIIVNNESIPFHFWRQWTLLQSHMINFIDNKCKWRICDKEKR